MSADSPRTPGRWVALATLAVSAALFLTALFGIASIDPGGADAAAPAPPPSSRGVTIQEDGRDPDCPRRHEQQRERGVTS
jgi:hypothetical protein